MRTIKLLALFLSVLTMSLVGCKKEKQMPSGGGGGGGSSDTYDCVDGNCNNVGSGGAYASFSDCQNACGGEDLLFKDFNDNSLTSGGWTQYVVTSSPQSHQWEIGNFSGTNPYAVVNGFDDPGSSETEIWLISPPVSLNSDFLYPISFRNASKYQGNELKVMMTIDYDGSSDPTQQGEWQDVTSDFNWDTNPNAFSWTESGVLGFYVSISTNNFRVAFQYTSTNMAAATWEVDDILLGDQAGTTGGYNCVSGNCQSVISGAQFTTLSECQTLCSGGTSGYNCVSGNCQSVGSGAQYGTLSQCQAACGGSSNDCCDCTGIGFVCDECCDGEFDMLGESWATWLQIFESNGCNCE